MTQEEITGIHQAYKNYIINDVGYASWESAVRDAYKTLIEEIG